MEKLTRIVEEIHGERPQLLHHHAATNTRIKESAEVDQGPGGGQALEDGGRLADSRRTRVMLASCLLVLLAAGLLIGWILLNLPSSEPQEYNAGPTRIGDSAAGDGRTEWALENRIAALVERVETLSDSVVELESRLERVHAITNSIVVAGQAIERVSGPGQFPGQVQAAASLTASSAEAPSNALAEPVPQIQRAPEAPETPGSLEPSVNPASDLTRSVEVAIAADSPGPWVINLMSSQEKADADRFERRLQSEGLQAEQQQVAVAGKTYWRVQITGISTLAEAAAYSESIAEELGIEDAWVMKR